MKTKVKRSEAIVDAIAALNNFHKPDSTAYQLRNPLLLKSFAKPGKHEVNEDGLRIFDSALGGLKSAIFDVELKISGESNTGLKPTDKLRNLLAVYGMRQESDILSIVYFLRKALADKDIDQYTPLSYFSE